MGGAGEIGASSTFMRVGDTQLLIDCGIRFKGESALPDLAPLSGERLDAILVTHAHTDHTGALPVLAEAFPGVPIYATPPTIDLVMILVKDALKLMNLPERESEIPLYTERQVDKLFDALTPQPAHTPLIINDLEITFSMASHILGAAMIHLRTPAGDVLFTGDYSVESQRTVPGLDPIDKHVDLVITESTYGNRLHENRSIAEQRMIKQIRAVVEEDGRVLIPAFAIGRAQEVLLILKSALRDGTLPEVPIFVDGMVRSVCDVYQRHVSWVSRSLRHATKKEGHPFFGDDILRVNSAKQRQKVLEHRPSITIASSGMLTGGASSFYAAHLAPDKRDAIFLTGYQDEESPGRRLINLTKETGPRVLQLGEQTVNVECRFDTYGLSAHADRMQMIGFLDKLKPRTVVLVHGDKEAKESFAANLEAPDVVIADNGDTLKRRYRLRGERPKALAQVIYDRTLEALGFDEARELLGPPGTPINGRRVAEEWFGSPPPHDLFNAFISRLEAFELIARDDKRRSMLWVLAPGETDALSNEAELERLIKSENPKGRLFELCQRLKIPLPEFQEEISGAHYVVQAQILIGARCHDSGAWRAAAQKTAEQLACRALLGKLTEIDDGPKVIRVLPERQAELTEKNPKGQLLERLMKRPDLKLELDLQPTPKGFRCQARLADLETAWYSASGKRLAEQGAADAMLALTDERQLFRQAKQPTQQPQALSGAEDPRTRLNLARQAKEIRDFGYTAIEAAGEPHARIFTLAAWATTHRGERLEGERVSASSKKEAQRLAAAALLERLGG